MTDKTQFNPSALLCYVISAMPDIALTEIWETLTPDNVNGFLGVIECELQARKEAQE